MTLLTLEKEKPMYKHALIQGAIALIIVLFLTSGYAWDVTARMIYETLRMTSVRAEYVHQLSTIYVKLLDGTVAEFQISTERSGLVSLAVFIFISTFTMGLLRGPILTKMGWFLLGIGVGIFWNINRLILVIIVAYNFGLTAFSFFHYLIGPSIDFLWVVSMWALGMSWLKKNEGEEGARI